MYIFIGSINTSVSDSLYPCRWRLGGWAPEGRQREEWVAITVTVALSAATAGIHASRRLEEGTSEEVRCRKHQVVPGAPASLPCLQDPMTSRVYHVTRVREESYLSILGKCLFLESDDTCGHCTKCLTSTCGVCVSVCVDYLL